MFVSVVVEEANGDKDSDRYKTFLICISYLSAAKPLCFEQQIYVVTLELTTVCCKT